MDICFHPINNYGDLLNFPIFRHYFGERFPLKHYSEISSSEVFMGIGTLAQYVVPEEWFAGKKVTFLGTGCRAPLKGDFHGFVRGKMSEQRTGVPAVGDLGLLVDRCLPTPGKKDKTAIIIDKMDNPPFFDLPNPERFSTRVESPRELSQVHKRIGEARYIVTDRLHVAITAEALGIPWVIYNHGQGDLADTPDKFLDWAGMIGKERFILSNGDIGIIEENTDFEASERQKDRLEEALRAAKEQATMKFDFVVIVLAHRLVEASTIWCFEKARWKLKQKWTWVPVIGDALVGRARSKAATHFLDSDLAPYMIFLDSDIIFTPEDLERLYGHLENGYDLIGGVYVLRGAKQVAHYGYGGTIDIDGTVKEVKYLCTGFMGISRRLLEKIRDELDLPLCNENDWSRCYAFFESGQCYDPDSGWLYLSEDWDFCDKARRVGVKPYLDTGIQLGHTCVRTWRVQDLEEGYGQG